MNRDKSFGQTHDLSIADRAGRYLSTRKARKVFSKQSVKIAADIGCGYEASIGRILFSRAENLHLVDVSVSKQGQAIHERIHEGYLPEVLIKIENNSLDAVLLNNVLEHLSDMDGTLKFIYQKMNTNGVLFINVPTGTMYFPTLLTT